MATTRDVSALPPWARGELPPGALCASRGHSPNHPVKAKALITEWFSKTDGEVTIGWRRVTLPHPVCGRHLSDAQKAWEGGAARREMDARTEARATELKEALEFFRASTGIALDAGLADRGRPNMVFTLDPAQLRHLAESITGGIRKGLAPGLEASPAEEALDNVIQFPGSQNYRRVH